MNQLKEKLSIIFDKYLEEFKEVNEYIYNNPELGHQEFKACEALTNLLKKHNFETSDNYAGISTAFIGKYKSGNGGAKIAILAEYDALPGIGHGCGHNIFGVTSVAAGILLKEIMGDVVGEVLVIGTPAELK